MNTRILFRFVLVVSVFVGACAGKRRIHEIQNVKQMSPAHVRIRRPTYEPAWPKSNPGGTDYHSQPSLPSSNLDCEEVEVLIKDVDMAAFFACVGSLQALQKKTSFAYRLKREVQPRLELQIEKTTPECIKKTVPSLAVPRDFFYQSLPLFQPGQLYSKAPLKEKTDTGPYYECYATGLDIHADEFMGEKVAKAGWQLDVTFPLLVPPHNEVEARRLLLGWMLTPFFTKEKGDWVIPSKIVPRTLCKECFGEESVLRSGNPLPLLWPIPNSVLKDAKK